MKLPIKELKEGVGLVQSKLDICICIGLVQPNISSVGKGKGAKKSQNAP